MARYTEDQAGMEELARAPFLVAEMARRAEAIKARAEAISPVLSGRYKASWEVHSGVRDGKAWAQVRNATPYAVYLEYGTRYMARQRVLGRAIDAAKD